MNPQQRLVCVCHGHGSILLSTHLSPVPHVDVGAHRLEGTGAAGQQVGAVVGLQETDKVGTLRLEEGQGRRAGSDLNVENGMASRVRCLLTESRQIKECWGKHWTLLPSSGSALLDLLFTMRAVNTQAKKT